MVTRFMLQPTTVRVLCALLALFAIGCTLQSWALWSQLDDSRAKLTSLRTRVSAPPRVLGAPLPSDFTAQWPPRRIDDEVLDNALRDAQRVGVRITAANASVHPDSRDVVRQSQFTIEARGTYANFKAWLNEVTGRQSGLAIDGLEVRRAEVAAGSAGAPQEVVASVRFRLFMRPREGR
jgi:hypothetical protein